jgi:hypothetical protein
MSERPPKEVYSVNLEGGTSILSTSFSANASAGMAVAEVDYTHIRRKAVRERERGGGEL